MKCANCSKALLDSRYSSFSIVNFTCGRIIEKNRISIKMTMDACMSGIAIGHAKGMRSDGAKIYL